MGERPTIWHYRTCVGTFVICPDTAGIGKATWSLWIDDGRLGSYPAPSAAADGVYLCTTGFDA